MRAHLLSLVPLLALLGCSSAAPSGDDAGGGGGVDAHAHHAHDSGVVGRPSCETIIARCHNIDPGSGLIHECHEGAHDEATTESVCAAMLEMCVMACSVDAGTSDHDAGHDHGHMH